MKKKLYLDYILMQLLYFAFMGTLISYGSYALLQLGYTASVVGIIMAFGSLLSVILQPIAANISDNSKKYSLFNLCIFISIACLLLSVALFIQKSATLIVAICYVGIYGIYNVFEPLINTIPTILKNNNIEINFGVGRAMGSAGYAAANALLGMLTSIFPFKVVFVSLIVVSILILIVSYKSNADFKIINTKVVKQEEASISYSEFLKRHKSFLLLMICTVGIYLGYTMTDNMMILVVNNIGGTSSDLGLILAFKAMLEIPTIFFYSKLEKHIPTEKLLMIAVISMSIKSIILCLAKSIIAIYAAQLFQMCGLALEIPAIVSYIGKIMDKKEATRGQAMFIMATTIASASSSLFSGTISDLFSTNTMLIVACLVTSISVIFYLILLNKKVTD